MATIELLLKQMFPKGTRKCDPPNWDKIPFWPPDVFAFVAKIVEISGAYQHIVPHSKADPKDPFGIDSEEWREQRDLASDAIAWGLLWHRRNGSDVADDVKSHLTQAMSEEKAAKLLKCDLSFIDGLWADIVKERESRICSEENLQGLRGCTPHMALVAAIKLLIIMDQSCTSIGFFPIETQKNGTYIHK